MGLVLRGLRRIASTILGVLTKQSHQYESCLFHESKYLNIDFCWISHGA